MAFSKNQREKKLPTNASSDRKSIDFLPKYFKTDTNAKFLGATIDQLISQGNVDKINAYIGRKFTETYSASDSYIDEISTERANYQLEPALVIKDSLDNVSFFKDYNDYINQIKFFNAPADNHSVLNSQEYYAWNPHVDWDKLVNYREYYWLPNGPQVISISGQSTEIESTYTITVADDGNNRAYVFSPDGLTRNPNLVLYRGQTYRFEVDCPNYPIAFSTIRQYVPSQSLIVSTETGTEGSPYDTDSYDTAAYDLESWQYNTDYDIFTTPDGVHYDIWTEGVISDTEFVEKGIIEFTVPQNAPNILYYVSKHNINTGGIFKIYDIKESTFINVEQEIIGKKSYTIRNGAPLSNGMKVKFTGQVVPEKYAEGNWYVEGVGDQIQLIAEKDLEVPAIFTNNEAIGFDDEKFDSQGFDVNNNFPGTKDYITINRASKDRNAWSRYNRWFHRDVIETSALLNDKPAEIDQLARAIRPIIEFKAGLQLFNHGKQAKANVDLIDTYTTDVFSTIEGSLGYNVDGVQLVPGMRVLFSADTDKRVKGRIFKVGKLTHLGVNRITLLEEADTDPLEGETVLILFGKENRGKMFHYSNENWIEAQEKNKINQSPLFDVYDLNGNSFSNSEIYPGTTFNGCPILSYKVGNTFDSELGFNISYKNIENIGDIEFDFNLHLDTFTYQEGTNIETVKLDIGFLQINTDLSSTSIENGWIKSDKDSEQPVVRQYVVSDDLFFFKIDMFDKSGNLTDLTTKVYVNGVLKTTTDYEIYVQDAEAYVRFFEELNVNDLVVIECITSATKNQNGFYKFPINLEFNPLNLNLDSITLGEVVNHVKSIATRVEQFVGSTPGSGNLRDLGTVSQYGTRVVQHSAPLATVAYHLTDKKFNIIKALRYAKDEYNKFKRNLIKVASEYGFDGESSVHLDLLLAEIVKEKTKEDPFYFSDMVPFGAKFVFDQTVLDNAITDYPLTFDFDLNTLSEKAVLVYLNNELLLHGRQYQFVNTNFVRILVPIQTGDSLQIVQYSTTDGCYIPPTPSKLGLYPVYEPKKYLDTTYQEPVMVIQGHDGSVVVAYNDYRDDILLEFEKRIYNNIKISYDNENFDITDYSPGFFRDNKIGSDDLNTTLRQEFLKWTSFITGDYTSHTFFDRNNPFTFNYNNFVDDNNNSLSGFWRGIFKYFYDTDRPHLCPWEMLGFTKEPSWWQSVYGPAPYTRDNLILWSDLEQGLVKEPNKPVIQIQKYVRPGLMNKIPVGETGELLTPIQSNLVKGYISTSTEAPFKFGDMAPIETAWRRSSDYPFSLITALTLLQPAKMFSLCFDRMRQFRNSTGQLVYSSSRGQLRFNSKEIILPNTVNDSARVFASGLVNYLVDYATSVSLASVNNYKTNLENLQVRLSSKLGGFTSEEKFKLILDSRSASNNGNVFVPVDNYQIVLNTSSPILSISYSGVMIEKQEGSFIVRGYNRVTPEFKWQRPLETASDPVINVGGISLPFVEWTANKYYNKGSIVRYESQYYRTTVGHESSSLFELKYFAKLASLPVEGGRDIIIRKSFSSEVSTLHYGSQLFTVQEVVDFLLGYGEYLKNQGFDFEYYNTQLATVTNWQTSVKEFAFWTTQNWSAGSVISLSPSAYELNFSKPFCVVDNLYDDFYDYSIYKEDGTIIQQNFVNGLRENSNYVLKSNSNSTGIYHATLNLVQKEHVLILDNITVFNDVIYDQVQGYRQERIKVLGYKTSDWNGDFNIPGFVYDQATVVDWEPWRDYTLGKTVKYKEFYYSAKNNVPGSEKFDYTLWYKLNKKPTSQLLPNWDYRANQFFDFYDLDSNSFDVDQQKFAQHLIGYQKRQYLENIINDDIAQYKFYQGMIQEKGVQSSLSKLFDALNSADKDSLEFFEEWAIRLGQYGGTATFDEVEYLLDETKFLTNPQPIELSKPNELNDTDTVYRILPDQTYLKSENYNHTPFPTTTETFEYVSTAGYVRPDDVKYIIKTKDEFANFNIKDLRDGDYFWVGYDKNTWNVYRFSIFEKEINNVSLSTNFLRITLNRKLDADIKAGEFVGISNTIESLQGIYRVIQTGNDYFDIEIPDNFDDTLEEQVNQSLKITLYKFLSHRIKNIDDLNQLSTKRKENEIAWIDGVDNNWSVWKYQDNYTFTKIQRDSENYGSNVIVSHNNLMMAVQTTNEVVYYSRASEFVKWEEIDRLKPNYTNLYEWSADPRYQTHNFGAKMELSESGSMLFITALGYTYGQNSGYVAKFNKTTNNYYNFERIIKLEPSQFTTDPLVLVKEFGHQIKVYKNYLIVSAKGDNSVREDSTELKMSGLIAAYNLIDNTFTTVNRFTEVNIFGNLVATEVVDFDVSKNGLLSVVLKQPTETGYSYKTVIYSISNEGQFTQLQTIIETSEITSVSVSSLGDYLAVGLPTATGLSVNQGLVKIYKNTNEFLIDQQISSPTNQNSEFFGFKVKFNIDNTQLVICSRGGHQDFETTFDNNTTTFDLDSIKFIDILKYRGTVRLFDKYDSKFVYSTDLEVQTSTSLDYASNISVTNRIYINAPATNDGSVYEFYAPEKSWSVYRKPDLQIDLNKIKSIFLYNTKTNSLITYLDFIDPVRGKILGIAEQELKFKTHYDPAIYSVGDDNVVVDSQSSWQEKNVGRLWWDLSAIKFLNPYQGSILYKSNTWNTTFANSSVDIYEWVESEYLPSEWDALADTEEGLTLGISGKSKYGDLVYSFKQRYDSVTKTFSFVYYFWVKNKAVTPNVEFRKISAKDVSTYISDPKSKGMKYVAVLGNNQFSLTNCQDLLINSDVAINFRYWTVENTDINVHSHYQLIAEGDSTQQLNKYIEQKWFDSLVGVDAIGNTVPDMTLPVKLRYGVLSRPRQSMFVNRIEALKQLIERVNRVLIKTLLIDDYNFEVLNSKEEAPSIQSKKYDLVVDTYEELRFVGTSDLKTAELTPVVEDGKLKRVFIKNPGQGYGTLIPVAFDADENPILWQGPSVTVFGTGSDAKVNTFINSRGEIVSAIVENEGKDYRASADGTSVIVRPFTVLVASDETALYKWTLNTVDSKNKRWARQKIQTYDTTKFWRYEDWYQTGYNKFTKIDHEVNFSYEIPTINVQVGSIVKINYEGKGGWLLLEKVQNQQTLDLAVNYKVIGRQNGTIQFNSNLYNYKDNIGYDTLTYDTDLYDSQPKEEIKIILNCIKNNLFVNDLKGEYNKLFFASLRYVFSEQLVVDWAFKTSFVKSKHNLGELSQTSTFQPNNLENYETYINEVKPYRTKVREFISNFDKVDNTNTVISDFDLPARYNYEYNTIVPFQVKVEDGRIVYDSEEIFNEPNLSWYNNVGNEIQEIVIVDGGDGYVYPPRVQIDGAATIQATATAYISQGKVNKIIVNNPGQGYLEVPSVSLIGSVSQGGRIAKAVAISGNSLVRSVHVGIKFDRISPVYQITDRNVQESFIGSGSQSKYKLKWPIDLGTSKTTVIVNNEELLSSDFKVYNELDKTAPYTRYIGIIEFSNPTTTVPSLSEILVTYVKDISVLHAADRIQHYYNAVPGMIGKELDQLMAGVDYGGVELTGFSFNTGNGWDSLPWQTGSWDNFDPDYTDHLELFDNPTSEQERTFALPFVPLDNEIINIYLNGTRIDDEAYGTNQTTNPNAIMKSFVGDGSTFVITLPEEANYAQKNTVIFRKITSDGSFMPTGVYDTKLVGGVFDATSAAGLNPADIDVDGDKFITPSTSYAPEEVIPGHVADTVEITVFNKSENKMPTIETSYYTVDDSNNTEYQFNSNAGTKDSIIVKVNNIIKQENTEYEVDFSSHTINFITPLMQGDVVSITTISQSGNNVLEINTVIAEQGQQEIITLVEFSNQLTIFATVNGISQNIIASDSNGILVIEFETELQQNDLVNYIVVDGDIDSISKVEKEQLIYNGNSMYELSIEPRVSQPFESNVIVEVDGRILHPADFIYFDVVGSSRTFKISNRKYANNSIETANIHVYLNGTLLSLSTDYSWSSALNELRLKRGVAKVGDKIVVEITKNAEYSIHYNDQQKVELDFNIQLDNNQKINILTFSNHDILSIERTTENIKSASQLSIGSNEYYVYTDASVGRFNLSKSVINESYVWVTLNNKLLTPIVDYVLESDRQHISLNENLSLSSDDIINIITFGNNVSTEEYSYKIFKDILNRTTYTKVKESTELSKSLGMHDLTITVSNGAMLSTPIGTKHPGVIFIEGERIEYFVKNGNVLSQLRRGTLGTGIKQMYEIGTTVVNQSIPMHIPYQDTVITSSVVIEEPSNLILIDFIPSVRLDTISNDNTWFRQTIPNNYGQSDDIEVFVGGRRLRKAPTYKWDVTNGPDSPVGDMQLEAEFSVDGVTNSVRLTQLPLRGEQVQVYKRIGKLWMLNDETLSESKSVQATFIRS